MGKMNPVVRRHKKRSDPCLVIENGGQALYPRRSSKKDAYRYSGYPGGLTKVSFAHVPEKKGKREIGPPCGAA